MPGALVMLKIIKSSTPTDNCKFQRFIMCFPGLRDGFKKGYRPFICFEGYHLKEPFESVLLLAVTLDASQ